MAKQKEPEIKEPEITVMEEIWRDYKIPFSIIVCGIVAFALGFSLSSLAVGVLGALAVAAGGILSGFVANKAYYRERTRSRYW